jgi:hypothetical protein
VRGRLRLASLIYAMRKIEQEVLKLYAYGLRARPLSIGTVPRDFCGFDARYRNEAEKIRHGVVFYMRQLTAKEISDFELQIVDINTISEYDILSWKH